MHNSIVLGVVPQPSPPSVLRNSFIKETIPEPSAPVGSALASSAFFFLFSARVTAAFVGKGFVEVDAGGFEVAVDIY